MLGLLKRFASRKDRDAIAQFRQVHHALKVASPVVRIKRTSFDHMLPSHTREGETFAARSSGCFPHSESRRPFPVEGARVCRAQIPAGGLRALARSCPPVGPSSPLEARPASNQRRARVEASGPNSGSGRASARGGSLFPGRARKPQAIFGIRTAGASRQETAYRALLWLVALKLGGFEGDLRTGQKLFRTPLGNRKLFLEIGPRPRDCEPRAACLAHLLYVASTALASNAPFAPPSPA